MICFFNLGSHRISEWSLLIIIWEFKNPSHKLAYLIGIFFLIYVERFASFLNFWSFVFEMNKNLLQWELFC